MNLDITDCDIKRLLRTPPHASFIGFSSVPHLLRDTVGIDALVNADLIAEGLSAFRPQESAVQAGRILLARLRKLTEQRADFAFESTLSGRALRPFYVASRAVATNPTYSTCGSRRPISRWRACDAASRPEAMTFPNP